MKMLPLGRVEMRVEECDGFRPRIRRGGGVVDRTGVVVKAVGRSLIEVESHCLAALNHPGHDFRNPAVLVVIGFREYGEQFGIHVVPRR